jgi:hypothetical protein
MAHLPEINTIAQSQRHSDVMPAGHTFFNSPARSPAMDFLWSLFSLRRRHRHYARLDQQGICLAFKHCAETPCGQGWVEVHEAKLCWLQRPLPASARVTPRSRAITARHMLSI